MNYSTCLYCLQPLEGGQNGDFHPKCSRIFFGNPKSPELPYALADLHELAKQIIRESISVTGVQPKLSLSFERNVVEGTFRLTLVGLWGNFILKPPTAQYPELVENEHLTMRLASIFGIITALFSFIRLKSGELAYLTRRMDRIKNHKLAMEDLCQLSERLTEYKYRGFVEQVAKIIRKFSSNPGLDVLRFFEVVLFSFLTGNADMHLKNYSLLTLSDGTVQLAPAYDLVATKLALPQDLEESALTINGKKSRLQKNDFKEFASHSGIPEKAVENIFRRFFEKQQVAVKEIKNSFLSETLQQDYTKLLNARFSQLEKNL